MVDLTEKYVGKEWLNSAGERMNPNLAFLTNEVWNYDILVMEGGTRSGKSYATMQFFWANMDQFSRMDYGVVRQSLPVLKGTIIQDFMTIGKEAGIYKKANHNLTEQIYKHNGNELWFFSGEDEEKLLGRAKDIIYLNEAPELPWSSVRQLFMRTKSKIIIDYNPNYPDSWVDKNILTRPEVAFIRTTFKDNPFVPKRTLDELEWMRINDPDGYLVYGLGQKGEIKGQIYSNWKKVHESNFHNNANVWVIDFGFSGDPACIAKFRFIGRTIYAKEMLYETGQSNLDLLIHLFFLGYDEDRGDILIADSANPQNIAELRYGTELDDDYLMDEVAKLKYRVDSEEKFLRLKKMVAGISVMGAIKGTGSIKAGIRKVKAYEVLLTDNSHNAWAEFTKYKYKEDRFTGRSTTEPIDKDNHFCDCLRYAALAEGRYFFAEKEK